MNKFYLLILVAFVCFATEDADKTLFGSGDINHGGYGAFTSEFSSIDGEYGYLSGWKGAWVINKTFSVGFGNYNLATDLASRDSLILDLSYSGLEFEYVYKSNAFIHGAAKVFLGSGALQQKIQDEDDDDRVVRDDHIFVIQPSITGEVNITRWFRIGTGFGYRFVADVELPDYSNEDISGFSGQVVLKFGWNM